MQLKIATWNINSVRLRLPLVELFVERYDPDIVCLQEIKCSNADFPAESIQSMGYPHIEVNGQKGYHGVAILSKIPLRRLDAVDFDGSGNARYVGVELELKAPSPKKYILHNFYVPAGGDIPDPETNPKFRQKLDYLSAMADWGKKLKRNHRTTSHILVGDLNVAPLETDVWSHKQLLKVVSHTPVEVSRLTDIMAAGKWQDIVRHHIPPEEKLFTWWSYRARDWRASNRGRRLDHIWATSDLVEHSSSLDVIDTARDWHKPSDHIPVIGGFEF